MSYRNMFKYIVFICLIIYSTPIRADNALVDFGVGVGNSSGSRILSVGVQEDLLTVFKVRWITGGWLDRSNDRSSSGYVFGQMGAEIDSGSVLTSVFIGPGLITEKDDLLGGNIEFLSSLNIGLQDKNRNYLGVGYRHVSNAGLYEPNIGRDFVVLEFMCPF